MSKKEDEKSITVPLSEYEHLKEVKQERLNELQNEIDGLQTQMFSEKINSIIRCTISI